MAEPTLPSAAPSITPAPTPVPTAPPAPATLPQQPVPVPPKSSNKKLFIIIGIIIIILSIAAYFLAGISPRKGAKPGPTPPIQPFPTPTPQRFLSPIATQSAFLIMEQSVASLSSHISVYNTQDPTLTPPVLVLPLGFTNQ